MFFFQRKFFKDMQGIVKDIDGFAKRYDELEWFCVESEKEKKTKIQKKCRLAYLK